MRIPHTWFAKLKGTIVVPAVHYSTKREAARTAIELRRTQKLPAKVILPLPNGKGFGKPMT